MATFYALMKCPAPDDHRALIKALSTPEQGIHRERIPHRDPLFFRTVRCYFIACRLKAA